MNRFPASKRAVILALVEGNSIDSIARTTGVSIRIHQTLRVTPAMEAGITDHVWSFEELIALLDQSTSTKRKVA